MGLRDKLAATKQNAQFFAAYGTHTVNRDEYKYLPPGKFGQIRKPIRGAVAEYEPGSAMTARTTLTRVAAGAIIAGPVGAIVGGLFKKDRARGYVTVTFPDGDVIVVDGPLSDEPKLREFATKINLAAAGT